MTNGYLVVAVAYLFFSAAVLLFEVRRTRRSGVDVTMMFMVITLMQCCFPAIALYGALPFVDPDNPAGNDGFNRILGAGHVDTALTVLVLTVWFVVFIYVGLAVGRLALAGLRAAPPASRQFVATVLEWRLLLLLALGMGLTLLSFYLLGDNLTSRFVNLILLRAGYEGVERTALNANAFALTQSWSWLALIALFAAWEQRRRGVVTLVLVAALVFAVLGVSRRAVFLPLVLSYLILVLARQRWRLRWIAAGLVPLVIWLAFGKELFAAIGNSASFGPVGNDYASWTTIVVRAAADAGLTVVESVGTLSLLHLPLRFGVDHILSLAQRFPEGMLGWDFNFPERIVRISTAALIDPGAQDLAPGLAGQMWLDFGVLGPMIWGLAFGLQVSVLQWCFERTRRTLSSAAVFVLLAFLVALPVNTGSFDFSFSVDIFMVLAGIFGCVRIRRDGLDVSAAYRGPPLVGPAIQQGS